MPDSAKFLNPVDASVTDQTKETFWFLQQFAQWHGNISQNVISQNVYNKIVIEQICKALKTTFPCGDIISVN